MKHLTDADIEKMANDRTSPAPSFAWGGKVLLGERFARAPAKLGWGKLPHPRVANSLRSQANSFPPRYAGQENPVIDCHGRTIDDAFREIENKINDLTERGGPELTIITGRSGEINRLLRLAIDGGKLADKIKSWTMPNPGCYKLRIKKEKL